MSHRDEKFVQLVHENDARLRKICRVYTDGTEAQRDLYQDILVELWRSFPSFEGDSSPSTWLYRVALNTALSHDRAQEVRADATLDPDHPMWENGPLLPTKISNARIASITFTPPSTGSTRSTKLWS